MNDIGESLQSEELRGAEEGGEREQTDEEASIFSREEEGSPQSLGVGEKPGQASRFVPVTRQKDGRYASWTHRSRDVRAGAPLAVGPGCRGASDFLLLAQQLPVLLLPVLHVDQQRDEAVLHLHLETGFKDRTGGQFHEKKKKVGRRKKKEDSLFEFSTSFS